MQRERDGAVQCHSCLSKGLLESEKNNKTTTKQNTEPKKKQKKDGFRFVFKKKKKNDGIVAGNPNLDFGTICSFQLASCPVGNHLSWRFQRRKRIIVLKRHLEV